MVQSEGIITQLVFDHALRIRVKSETGSSNTPASSAATTPDNASIADASERSESPTAEDDDAQTAVSEGTNVSKVSKGKHTQASSESTTATATEKPQTEGAHAGNLVGKLNNLVTSDLSNVTNGRDFMFICALTLLILSATGYRLKSNNSDVHPPANRALHLLLVQALGLEVNDLHKPDD